jgi:hypothetical protein
MPRNEDMCRHFMQLHDAFKDHADSIQKSIDKIVKELDGVLVGPYRTGFSDDMKDAATIDEQIAAAEAASARLVRDWRKLVKAILDAAKAKLPTDPWPPKAQKLLADLEALLRALKALRELEAAMGSHVAHWCE